MEIIKTITDWPVIVQGALGSALFWLVFEIGQRGTRALVKRLGQDKKTTADFVLMAREAQVWLVPWDKCQPCRD